MPGKTVQLPVFLKWAGGKRQLLPELTKRFPKDFSGYVEPFLGGGTVFFQVKKERSPKKVFLSDINGHLINCFIQVRDNPEKLSDLLEEHRAHNSKEHYYTVRALNGRLDKTESAARLIYLNKTCFNGLYRVNSKNEFNVPYGNHKKPAIPSRELILSASEFLKNARIREMAFDKLDGIATKGDFVYFDPPYLPVSKTANFTAYSAKGFTETDQINLHELFKNLSDRGCFVLLSNSYHPKIRELYSEFNVESVLARRSINSVSSGRGPVKELIITNY